GNPVDRPREPGCHARIGGGTQGDGRRRPQRTAPASGGIRGCHQARNRHKGALHTIGNDHAGRCKRAGGSGDRGSQRGGLSSAPEAHPSEYTAGSPPAGRCRPPRRETPAAPGAPGQTQRAPDNSAISGRKAPDGAAGLQAPDCATAAGSSAPGRAAAGPSPTGRTTGAGTSPTGFATA